MARKSEKELLSPFDPDLIDPHKSYWVYSHNPRLTADYGSIAPVRMQDGKARLDAVPEDAEPDVIEERRELLVFFQNAHQTQVPTRVWNDERNTMIVDGYKMVPTYRIEIDSGSAPRQGRARQLAGIA